MELSVIIPTRNRAALLGDLLDALDTQTLAAARYEVIVVDNGSTDATAAVVAARQVARPNLRYVLEPSPGLHAGRHCGLREARAELLVFADDDILPDLTWLAGHLASFADPDVAMAGGNNRPAFEVPPPDWLERLWRRPFAGGQGIGYLSVLELPGPARDIDPDLVWGCNFAIRRSALTAVGGFHPDSVPEALLHLRGDGETHVSRAVAAAGWRCRLNPDASVRHRIPAGRMSFRYFRERAYRQGISDSYTQLRRLGGRLGWGQRVREAPRLVSFWGRLLVRALTESDRDLRRLAVSCALAHRSGVAFHRAAARSDPKLRAWIMRADYLEESS